jgi:hypothetical protein
VALRLKRNGIMRVRPLQGGLTLWMDQQFPVSPVGPLGTQPDERGRETVPPGVG